MSVSVKEFGKLENGQTAKLYTITNGAGTEASFTDLGAAWVSMKVQDRDGKYEDVVFGYDDAETYYNNPTSCGECIGRSANRISKGHFVLEGKEYQLAKNNGENNLHSGPDKWAKKLFTGQTEETRIGSRVTFRLLSPDGSQGYPGELLFSVSYTLTEQDELIMEYRGSADRTTIINPTNHAYFNLRGHGAGDIGSQLVWINADRYTPSDAGAIPTGEIAPVEGTPMDFTIMKPIGQDIDADFDQLKNAGGYDHNYVLNGFDGRLNLVAKAKDPESGRKLKVYTDLPGMQFYTGNGLKDGQAKGKGGVSYPFRSGFCFETQFFPDAVNHPEWPQPVFGPGKEYHHYTVFKFEATKLIMPLDQPEEKN